MPIDPSIPLQAGQGVAPPQNLLDTFGKYQGIANAMASNDLIKANTTQTNQNVAQSASNYMAQKYASFLTLPEAMQTQANARQFVEHSLADGSITPAVAATMHAKINATNNVDELRGLAVTGMVSNLTGQTQLDATTGKTDMLNTGGGNQPIVTRPAWQGGGSTPVGAPIPTTFTPGEQLATVRVPVIGPDGKPIPDAWEIITGVEAARRARLGHLVPGYGQSPPGGGQSAPVVPPGSPLNISSGSMGNGRLPAPLLNPNRQPPPGTPDNGPSLPIPPIPPAVVPPISGATPAIPGVPTAGPGASTGSFGNTAGAAATAAANTTGTSSAQAFRGITDAGVEARKTDSILSGMQAASDNFTSGPLAGASFTVKAWLQSIIPVMEKDLRLAPNSVSDQEVFRKWAAQLQSTQGAGGPGTDARLAISGLANPDAHLSPAGLSQILGELRGNQDYIKARAALAAKFPNQADYSAFESQVGANLDPRVFQYERLNPTQRGNFLTHIKDVTDREAFKRAHGWAQSNGLLNAGQ